MDRRNHRGGRTRWHLRHAYRRCRTLCPELTRRTTEDGEPPSESSARSEHAGPLRLGRVQNVSVLRSLKRRSEETKKTVDFFHRPPVFILRQPGSFLPQAVARSVVVVKAQQRLLSGDLSRQGALRKIGEDAPLRRLRERSRPIGAGTTVRLVRSTKQHMSGSPFVGRSELCGHDLSLVLLQDGRSARTGEAPL